MQPSRPWEMESQRHYLLCCNLDCSRTTSATRRIEHSHRDGSKKKKPLPTRYLQLQNMYVHSHVGEYAAHLNEISLFGSSLPSLCIVQSFSRMSSSADVHCWSLRHQLEASPDRLDLSDSYLNPSWKLGATHSLLRRRRPALSNMVFTQSIS